MCSLWGGQQPIRLKASYEGGEKYLEGRQGSQGKRQHQESLPDLSSLNRLQVIPFPETEGHWKQPSSGLGVWERLCLVLDLLILKY